MPPQSHTTNERYRVRGRRLSEWPCPPARFICFPFQLALRTRGTLGTHIHFLPGPLLGTGTDLFLSTALPADATSSRVQRTRGRNRLDRSCPRSHPSLGTLSLSLRAAQSRWLAEPLAQ